LWLLVLTLPPFAILSRSSCQAAEELLTCNNSCGVGSIDSSQLITKKH
jgi:hypothetical protein